MKTVEDFSKKLEDFEEKLKAEHERKLSNVQRWLDENVYNEFKKEGQLFYPPAGLSATDTVQILHELGFVNAKLKEPDPMSMNSADMVRFYINESHSNKR